LKSGNKINLTIKNKEEVERAIQIQATNSEPTAS